MEVKTEESKNPELENRAFQDLAKSIPQVLDESGPVKEAISSFIAYGTPSTEKLGSGERSGVIQSFVSAFNKLPQTEEDWNDIYKIATGYWPSQTSSQKEEQSRGFFETIYLRQPNANITQDQVAIDVMSYGIRPKNRNLDSEQTAIGYFISIFRKIPIIAIDWDIIRAIAYSGAKR